MIAVIFEVIIKDGQKEKYLELAADLREHLMQVDGFLSIERFASLSEDGKLCSLSFWEDEDAVKRWREFELHRVAQEKGRQSIFANYRIRVAKIFRDYGMDSNNKGDT